MIRYREAMCKPGTYWITHRKPEVVSWGAIKIIVLSSDGITARVIYETNGNLKELPVNLDEEDRWIVFDNYWLAYAHLQRRYQGIEKGESK